MNLKSTLGLLLAGLALTPAAAIAADYDPPMVIEQQAAEYVPVEVGSGWYLRGDVGYAAATRTSGNFTYRTFDAGTATYSDNLFTTGRLRNDFTFGIGFGYRLNEWFRADATVDIFHGRFNGTTNSAAPCIDPVFVPAFAGTSCRSEDSQRAQGLSFLANGYVDLGTYVGITPYVGAGAGFTRLQWNALSNSSYCVGATCPTAFVGTATHAGEKSWAFTYAAMAGFAYDVSKNIKLDLGYRYRRIAGGPMFGFDALPTALGAVGTQGRHPAFSSHEFKVGLRYELW